MFWTYCLMLKSSLMDYQQTVESLVESCIRKVRIFQKQGVMPIRFMHLQYLWTYLLDLIVVAQIFTHWLSLSN